MDMSKNADYGNWVPANMMKLLYGISAAAVVLTVVLFCVCSSRIPGIIALLVTLVCIGMTAYMQICRNIFDFNKGGMMGKVHQHLVDHFPWEQARRAQGVPDGSGTILDIGCGAAALTNRVAKTYPHAKLTGMDFWGTEWSYAKEQCERNAKAEGVADRVRFQKGDAAKLDFADETFDGAVSNFVFHEVRSASDKRDVVREALRVVKRGGAFAFQDMFAQKAIYGDMDAFIKELLADGTVKEIHYIANIEKQDFIPAFVTAPWMIQGAGLIYGIR